ncbi:hypothetical protein SAMN05216359_105316 [Roseateles sp. YR242]|uniref:hypothetical protein n=1 Tax=Roseateles sp. YR242 TaxID=1855305 RepID=UPI0008CF3B74|nr:hypothetical protein [Roseateles sp. YR242]SEL13276.1 hypothetical protein SAMN05216359_105316 [Roseateles sp. YR242]
MTNEAIRGTTEAWESGQLGASKAHAKRAPAELEAQIDEALGLQAISIRIPRSTIKAYKDIAEIYGVGYQPLMRDAICRWVEGEMKQLLAGAAETHRQEKEPPATDEAASGLSDAPQLPHKRAA